MGAVGTHVAMAGAAKGAGIAAIKAGTAANASAAKVAAAKSAVAAAKATAVSTSYASTYGAGTGFLGSSATTAILGGCTATTELVAIAACFAVYVDRGHKSESEARDQVEELSERSVEEQREFLDEEEREMERKEEKYEENARHSNMSMRLHTTVFVSPTSASVVVTSFPLTLTLLAHRYVVHGMRVLGQDTVLS